MGFFTGPSLVVHPDLPDFDYLWPNMIFIKLDTTLARHFNITKEED